MSLKTSIKTYLLSQTPVSTLISTRLRADVAAQGDTVPYVVYTVITDVGSHYLLGDDGTSSSQVQFDCYAATPLLAETLAETLRAELDGKRGTTGSVFWHFCHVEDGADGYQPPTAGQVTDHYRHMLTARIVYKRTAATPNA